MRLHYECHPCIRTSDFTFEACWSPVEFKTPSVVSLPDSPIPSNCSAIPARSTRCLPIWKQVVCFRRKPWSRQP